MKKYVSAVAVLLVLSFVLAGCGKKAETKTYDMPGLSQALLDSEAFSDILSPMDIGVAVMNYGFDKADVVDYVYYFSTRATAEEIGMFKCVDEAAAQRVLEAAKSWAQIQKDTYVSYAPLEPTKIDNGYVKADGVYVFYVIGNDADIVNGIMK